MINADSRGLFCPTCLCVYILNVMRLYLVLIHSQVKVYFMLGTMSRVMMFGMFIASCHHSCVAC